MAENKRNIQPKCSTKITQKELRSSSRLQKKIEKKREEDSQPMPRRSERNINSSVEYIYEFPEDDSNSDTVTAHSDIDVSEPSSGDKEKKKEFTEDTKKNVESKSSDDKNIEVKLKRTT